MANKPLPERIPEECEKGLVSVIVPAYNREATAMETLDSVLWQTYENWELIVVDDGSTDNTLAALEQYAADHPARRIRVLAQENSGPSRARNYGMCESRGEFIQILDSDDFIMPEKLKRQVELLENETGWDFAYGPTDEWHVDMEPPGNVFARELEDEATLDGYLDGSNWFHIQAPLFRRTALIRTGLYEEDIYTGEDSEYYARGLAIGLKGKYVHSAKSLRRVDHESSLGSASATPSGSEVFMKSRLLLKSLFDTLGNIADYSYDALAYSCSGRAWRLAEKGHTKDAIEIITRQMEVCRNPGVRASFRRRRLVMRFLGGRLTVSLRNLLASKGGQAVADIDEHEKIIVEREANERCL